MARKKNPPLFFFSPQPLSLISQPFSSRFEKGGFAPPPPLYQSSPPKRTLMCCSAPSFRVPNPRGLSEVLFPRAYAESASFLFPSRQFSTEFLARTYPGLHLPLLELDLFLVEILLLLLTSSTFLATPSPLLMLPPTHWLIRAPSPFSSAFSEGQQAGDVFSSKHSFFSLELVAALFPTIPPSSERCKVEKRRFHPPFVPINKDITL